MIDRKRLVHLCADLLAIVDGLYTDLTMKLAADRHKRNGEIDQTAVDRWSATYDLSEAISEFQKHVLNADRLQDQRQGSESVKVSPPPNKDPFGDAGHQGLVVSRGPKDCE